MANGHAGAPLGNQNASKYKDEYPEAMIAWFRSTAEDGLTYPTFEGFADSIGVLSETLRGWRDNNDCFRSAYARCLDIQRRLILQRALDRTYDSNFAKFVATNNLGMVEASALTVQGDKDKPLEIKIEIEG